MTSARAPTPHLPPTSQPTAADMTNLRRPIISRAEVAGKALFSTMLGQVAPRPVPHPSEPIIARGPNNMKFEVPQQIERFAQQLCDDFPDQCKDIFVGYYTIDDYFDPCDITRLGKGYLASVLDHIAKQNSTAVQQFTYSWCLRNQQGVQKICCGTTLGELFCETEIRERGELFLTLSLILVRNSLERTALTQIARSEKPLQKQKTPHAENPPHIVGKPSQDVDAKPHVTGPVQQRTAQAPASKACKGLYRVGLRQPQADPTGTESTSAAAVPTSQFLSAGDRFHPRNQSSSSVPATPLLSQQSPGLGQKPNMPRTTPRMQHYNTASIPSHQRGQSTPRMSAMAPGFTPQGPAGPPSRVITPQVAPAQLYFGSAPFMPTPPTGVHPALDIGAIPRDHSLLPGYAGYPEMHSSLSELPMSQVQTYTATQPGSRIPSGQLAGGTHSSGYISMPAYSPPPMMPPSLSVTTNMQHGAPPQNLRPRRVSGPGTRQDFGPRSQHKQFGKPSRGGRRNSIRGNHNGTGFHPPGAAPPGFQGSPHFQHPLPAATTEPFPPFIPPVEGRGVPGFRTRLPNTQEGRHSVWVHNIVDQREDIAGAGLRLHFEGMLNRPVMDVKVNRDKNERLYAHVNFATIQDAEQALALDGSFFHGAPLMVRVPMREQRIRQGMLQQQFPAHRNQINAEPLSMPLEQAPFGQNKVPYAPSDTNILAAPMNDRRRSTLERRSSVVTIKQRSRGPSRTYEATADNPMSYSPQDARRMQPNPSVLSKDLAEEARQPTPAQASPERAQTPGQELEQRPDSRASSGTTPRRGKRATIKGRDRSANRSGNSITTLELSTNSSMECVPAVKKQTTDSSAVVGCTGNNGLVDKTITTIHESGEQEKLHRETPKKQVLDQSSSGKLSPEKKKNKKSKKGEKRERSGHERSSDSGVPEKPSLSEVHAAALPDSSKPQPPAVECGPDHSSGGTKKVSHTQRTTKVAVPDITLHSRKEKQVASSTVSSTGRVSYAQAAAIVKTPGPATTASAAAKSPASEKDTESRYFTPMEIPSSPSTKSDRTLAPTTPLSVAAVQIEETTPEKDDSFVTVQEEPSSVPNRHECCGDTSPQPSEQTIEGADAHSDAPDAHDVSTEQAEHPHNSPGQHGAPDTTEQQDTTVEDVEAPASTASSSWADDAASHADLTSPEAKSNTEKSVKSAEKPKADSSSAVEGTAKVHAQVAGSIHPNARHKGEKKKQPKKSKSYGKGKKATK